MSATNPKRSGNLHEPMWQRTLRAFLGTRVRVTLRTGAMLEGELKEPESWRVTIVLAGGERQIEFDELLSVESAR